MILETGRLVLREFLDDDVEALELVLGDPQTMAYYPAPFSREDVVRWIGWSRQSYRKNGVGLWAVELKETGELIGDCGLTWQRVGYSPEKQLEIGWHVRRDLWNKGYATEAAIACRDRARDLGHIHLISIIAAANAPSQAVARKIGMELEREDELNDRLRMIFGMNLT